MFLSILKRVYVLSKSNFNMTCSATTKLIPYRCYNSNIIIFNQTGSMLLQALISAGLTTVLALTVATLFVQQNKQIKLMEQKSEIIDIKNEILMALSNPQVCGCNLNPSKLIPLNSIPAIEFNTSPASFSLNDQGLRADCNASTEAFLSTAAGKRTLSGLKVESIRVANLTRNGVTSNWNGRLEVKFSGSNIELKGISLPMNVESSGSGPFQVDTCSVVDNLDQTASCKSLGGELVGGKCIIQDPRANCESLGGTYDASTQKCRLNQGATSTTDCVSIYGAGWTFNGSACVPPATTEKGTAMGSCSDRMVAGGPGSLWTANGPPPVEPAFKTNGGVGVCRCREGFTLTMVSQGVRGDDAGSLGSFRGTLSYYTCIKN